MEAEDIANLEAERILPGKHTDINPTKLFMKECAGLKTGEKIKREKAKDTGVELLFNLCASKEGYLYQVANTASELPMRVVDDKLKEQEEKVPLKTGPYLDQSGENGIKNLSTTPRNEDAIDQWKNKENMRDAEHNIPFANGETVPVQYFDASPKRKKDKNGNVQPLTSLFDGITTVSKDVKWYQGEEEQARSTVVFHELWENYERTTNLEPYQYTKFDANNKPLHENALEYVEHDTKKGVHRKAVDAENGFYAKSKTPGAFTKAIDIKTGKIIKLEENKK